MGGGVRGVGVLDCNTNSPDPHCLLSWQPLLHFTRFASNRPRVKSSSLQVVRVKFVRVKLSCTPTSFPTSPTPQHTFPHPPHSPSHYFTFLHTPHPSLPSPTPPTSLPSPTPRPNTLCHTHPIHSTTRLPRFFTPHISPYLPHTLLVTSPTHFSTPSTLTPYISLTYPHTTTPPISLTFPHTPLPLPSPPSYPNTLFHTHLIHSPISPHTSSLFPFPLTFFTPPHLFPHPNTISHTSLHSPSLLIFFHTLHTFSHFSPHLPPRPNILPSLTPYTLPHLPHIATHFPALVPYLPSPSLTPNTLFHSPPPPPRISPLTSFLLPSTLPSPQTLFPTPPPHFPLKIVYCLQYSNT